MGLTTLSVKIRPGVYTLPASIDVLSPNSIYLSDGCSTLPSVGNAFAYRNVLTGAIVVTDTVLKVERCGVNKILFSTRASVYLLSLPGLRLVR